MNKSMWTKILSVLLVATLLSVLPLGTPPAMAASNYSDAELARAVDLGYGAYRTDNPTMTYAEFFKMLDKTVELADRSKLVAWQNSLPEARKASETMTRFEGMLAVFRCAEALGGNYLEFNVNYYPLNIKISTTTNCWDEIGRIPYDVFRFIHDESPYSGGGFTQNPDVIGGYEGAIVYFYSFGRASIISNKTLFDYDAVKNSMRPDEKFTYTEALLAALRLDESYKEIIDRYPTSADIDIVSKAEARKQAILSSPTNVTVTGTKYYVSNSGNDNNDGLTPATAWATLGKINSASIVVFNGWEGWRDNERFPEYLWASENPDKWITLKPGDGIFFERGGTWRGMLRTAPGVTYSAYGSGDKPEIFGSPENGSGAEKWSLVAGTSNIWVFYKDLQDCGGMLLGATTPAKKQTAYWDGTRYCDVGDKMGDFGNISALKTFDVKSLGNLRFFNDIKYAGKYWEGGAWGKLYIRCDAGNPGKVYQSIEFFTGSCVFGGSTPVEKGCVMDNLCFQYFSNGVGAAGEEITVQNCEVGWVGGMIGGYSGDVVSTTDDTSPAIVRFGDGIMAGGKNNRLVNNYVHHTGGAFTIESFSMYPNDGQRNHVISGNLTEYCFNGLLITDWYALEKGINAPIFQNLTINDNYFMYIGMGGYEPMGNDDGASTLAIFLSPGSSNINITNNTLYLMGNSPQQQLVGIACWPGAKNALKFSGNTYVQNNYGRTILLTELEVSTSAYYYHSNSAEDIKSALGDTTAKVLPLSLPPADLAPWAVPEVSAAIRNGLVPAQLQKNYKSNTTRAEFCALAVALYEKQKGVITGRGKFDDTNDVNVEKAAYIGVVNGTSPGKFTPDAPLTREQAATMLARLANAIGKPFPKQTTTFGDKNSISEWALEAVGQVQAAGIMNGTSPTNFSPKGPYTREQSIVTIWRMYDTMK